MPGSRVVHCLRGPLGPSVFQIQKTRDLRQSTDPLRSIRDSVTGPPLPRPATKVHDLHLGLTGELGTSASSPPRASGRIPKEPTLAQH